jgi:hypothetical protein
VRSEVLNAVLETQEGLNAGSRKRNRKKRDGTDNRYQHKLWFGIRRLGHALVFSRGISPLWFAVKAPITPRRPVMGIDWRFESPRHWQSGVKTCIDSLDVCVFSRQ